MALNDKQKRFVDEYLIDLNATQAAIRAGYSKATARQIASELLTKPDMQEAIQEAQKKRSERTQITQDWVIKRLAALADADIKRVAEWDEDGVRFKPSEELEWEDTYTISEVSLKETIKETEDGKELVLNREKKIKLPSASEKKANLELLGKHLEMFGASADSEEQIEPGFSVSQDA